MTTFEEEVIARRAFWQRSGGILEQLSITSATVHSLVLSGRMNVKSSPIKAKLTNLKDHAKLLSRVNVFPPVPFSLVFLSPR